MIQIQLTLTGRIGHRRSELTNTAIEIKKWEGNAKEQRGETYTVQEKILEM